MSLHKLFKYVCVAVVNVKVETYTFLTRLFIILVMAFVNFSILPRSVLAHGFCTPHHDKICFTIVAKFSTSLGVKNIPKRPLKYLFASAPVVGAGYYMYKTKQVESADVLNRNPEHTFLAAHPDVSISRTVKGATDDIDLNLTLFQYPTCPFCCKVRAFLDYYGLPYDVVEVDPVLRQQTSWTTYRKVPILLAKVENGFQQLNDSSMIVSALKTFLTNEKKTLKEIVGCYPITNTKNTDGTVKSEIENKYFIMLEGKQLDNKDSKMIMDEKKWREWADNTLVHTLSPNVYRSLDEAMQAFLWFSEVGEWDRLFPSWERNIIVYIGSLAMWIISKRLKKRHALKEDVRESLYDECRLWMKVISANGTTFFGGSSPNLADLAVYGVLSSIEGCLAFNDLLKHTSIGKWYFPMKEAIKNKEGRKEIMH